MSVSKKELLEMHNPRIAAFRMIAILHKQGIVNEATWRNVKDLMRQEFGLSTSLIIEMD